MTPSKRKRANSMKLVHRVMSVDEKLKSRVIMDRMLQRFGPSHHHMPRSVTSLAAILRGEQSMRKVTEMNRKYSWRRVE